VTEAAPFDEGSSFGVFELLLDNGKYGMSISVAPVFNNPTAVAVDAADNLFVVDTASDKALYDNAIYEVPYINGNYGAPITILTGLSGAIAVDATENLYVTDSANNQLVEIPFSNGTYGSPVVVGSGFNAPAAVAVDTQGRVYVTDADDIWMLTP
jgi:large repetitive protein